MEKISSQFPFEGDDRPGAPLATVPEVDRSGFGRTVVRGRHRLEDSHLFDDQALIDCIDSHPRHRLRVWTSGSDPLDYSQWSPVDTVGLGGAEILECMKKGTLWLNIQRVDLHNEA